jgi:hypothetical protein
VGWSLLRWKYRIIYQREGRTVNRGRPAQVCHGQTLAHVKQRRSGAVVPSQLWAKRSPAPGRRERTTPARGGPLVPGGGGAR